MNGLNLMNTACAYLEIGQGSLQALSGDAGIELPLERLPNGRLTASCKEKLTRRLEGFLKSSGWQARSRVLCAIGGRGVSLRRFVLPAATRENVHRLLLLQIEKEFPLPPDELAWGYRPVGKAPLPGNGEPARHEFLVAAVRKEVVEDYAELLSACGVTPTFSLAAIARSYVCPHPPGAYAVLDIGGNQSEWVAFEGGIPVAVRTLYWGSADIMQALAEKLGISLDEAEKVQARLEQTPLDAHELEPKTQAAIESALDGLVGALGGQAGGEKIYLTGKSAQNKALVARLAQRLGSGVVCEPLKLATGEGRSAAILGLKTASEKGTAAPPLVLQIKQTNGAASVARPAPWKWVSIAALLVLSLLALPYLEALLLKPRLAKKLAALKADRGRLPMIDHEFDFLQYLKVNQPPYLDTLYLLAKAAPQGSKLDSLSMNRRGDISLRCSMRNADQVTEFRKKLVDSGLFANVSVEEQTPTPDRQKVNVRMSGQWKPLAARMTLAIGPSAEEIEKAKTRSRDAMPGMPGMMPGMMPGSMGMPSMPTMEGGPPMRGSSSRRGSSMGGANRSQGPGGPPSGMPASVMSRFGVGGDAPGPSKGGPDAPPSEAPPPQP